MSLDWNLEKIENHKEKCWVEVDEKGADGEPMFQLAPVTNSLIWATMMVKIGEITEENAAEFYARLQLIETLDGRPIKTTVEEVRDHIGLSCNVRTESRREFLKTCDFTLDRLKAQYEKETQTEEVGR